MAKNKNDNFGVDNVIENLNLTGTFLEQKVHVSLVKHPQFVSKREHPYSTVNVLNEQMKELIEGTIDIFAAAMVSKNLALCLCIECKKADPSRKHWVFELRTTGDEVYPFVFYDHSAEALNYKKNIFFDSLGYPGMKYFDKAIQAYQFHKVKGSLSKNQTENVYNAALSANKAVKAFAPAPHEVFKFLNLTEKVSVLYLPVVVTTANLWENKYHHQHVSWNTGEIGKENLKLVEKDWIHYEFPLSVNLRLPDKDRDELDKSPTFIVKANKFNKFVKMILKDLPNRIIDIEEEKAF